VASPLVKTAAHGNDPNWGRILATVGASGVVSDQANLRISLQGTTVYHGARQDFDEQALSEAMKENDVLIEINLAAGEGSGTAWGCDLSSEYVQINAEYTT
jgi:glutamate N-acetyltransferase/amino-acid N-acetyltransferase